MLKITSIQANCGDSFLIEDTEASKNVLVDCGFKITYQQKIKHLTSDVDHLILTHSDEDHIHGAIPLIQDFPARFNIGKIYINVPSSYKAGSNNGDISILQAITLENLLDEKGAVYRGLLAGDNIKVSEDLNLEIISPTQEELEYYINRYKDLEESDEPDLISRTSDTIEIKELANKKDSYKSKKSDFANAASIAFILRYKKHALLFLGDAHPTVITDYLENKGYSENKKHVFDYIKLSHHGSITSISNKFISMISCSNFILSTNGGKSRSFHPSRETLAKISLKADRNNSGNVNFYFNYPIEHITARNGILISPNEALRYNIKLIEKNIFFLK